MGVEVSTTQKSATRHISQWLSSAIYQGEEISFTNHPPHLETPSGPFYILCSLLHRVTPFCRKHGVPHMGHQM